MFSLQGEHSKMRRFGDFPHIFWTPEFLPSLPHQPLLLLWLWDYQRTVAGAAEPFLELLFQPSWQWPSRVSQQCRGDAQCRWHHTATPLTMWVSRSWVLLPEAGGGQEAARGQGIGIQKWNRQFPSRGDGAQ